MAASSAEAWSCRAWTGRASDKDFDTRVRLHPTNDGRLMKFGQDFIVYFVVAIRPAGCGGSSHRRFH